MDQFMAICLTEQLNDLQENGSRNSVKLVFRFLVSFLQLPCQQLFSKCHCQRKFQRQ